MVVSPYHLAWYLSQLVSHSNTRIRSKTPIKTTPNSFLYSA
ncbi:hypothetical protein PALI_b0440 [Pseudoalteromonas aliena SW19]|uniref:Uncharacterized protein n=1 Tax=Pseudoalteromonas aliena SW19 TaxID=1314866 RepID=A0ABR9E4C7_9GAMM|nr:hypothetical protein [Pseudoalteromonas aliena SW19]